MSVVRYDIQERSNKLRSVLHLAMCIWALVHAPWSAGRAMSQPAAAALSSVYNCADITRGAALLKLRIVKRCHLSASGARICCAVLGIANIIIECCYDVDLVLGPRIMAASCYRSLLRFCCSQTRTGINFMGSSVRSEGRQSCAVAPP